MTTSGDKSRGKKQKKEGEYTKEEAEKIVLDERVKGHVILEIFARILSILKLEISDGKN